MATIFIRTGKLNLLTEFVAAMAENNYQVGLYKNQIVPSPTTGWSQVLEADFDGYSRVTFTGVLGYTWNTQTEQYAAHAAPAPFLCVGGSNTIYGWFIADGDGALNIMGAYSTPIVMSPALNPAINVTWTIYA